MLTLSYLNLITSEFRDKSNYIQMLTDVFDMYTNVANNLDNISTQLDVDNAFSNELDIIGELVGQSRNINEEYEEGKSSLDDDDYRTLLKSKILSNSWKGTIEEIYDLWQQLFPEYELSIYDNQDLTCTIFLRGNYSDAEYYLITHNFVIPKPAGVSYTYTSLNAPLFAYDYDNEESTKYKGYDAGYWSVFGSYQYKIFALDYDNDPTANFAGLDYGDWYFGG